MPPVRLNKTAKRRPRGRPTTWTNSRQRRLLRLYLCTPEEELPLRKILALLSEDGGFQPKERRAHQVLQNLLSGSYKCYRPKDRACMRRRLDCMRSVRRRYSTSGRRISGSNRLSTAFPTACRARSPSARDALSHVAEAAVVADQSTVDAKIVDSERQSRLSLIGRALSSSYADSFMAELVSLLGLSASSSRRTSLSASLRSSLRRFSLASVDGPTGRPVWMNLRSRRERISELEDHTPGSGTIQHFFKPSWTNYELVKSCCSRQNQLSDDPFCIHQRLAIAIEHPMKVGGRDATILVTAKEVNFQDSIGNTLLHVAMEWAAPLDVIASFVEAASDPSTPNLRGETFLHSLMPSAIKSVGELNVLLLQLQKRRFNFRQIDMTGNTFLGRLMTVPGLSSKALLCILETAELRDLAFWASHIPPEGIFGLLIVRIHQKVHLEGGRALGPALHCQALISRALGGSHGDSVAFSSSVQADAYTSTDSPSFDHARRSSPLHRLIRGLNRFHPRPVNRLQGFPYEPIGSERDIFCMVLNQALRVCEDVDERDPLTAQTPLMALLVQIAGRSSEAAFSKPLSEFITLQQDCVSTMLDFGASLTATDINGNTAVHYAAALGMVAALKILIANAANVKIKNVCGLTPAKIAASSQLYGKEVKDAYHYACYQECIARLIK